MNFLPLILLCLFIIFSLALAITSGARVATGMNASRRRFRKNLYPVFRVWSGFQGFLLAIGLPISIHAGELVWLNLLGLILWGLSPARSATVELLNLVRQRGFRAWLLSGIFCLTLLTNLQINLWFSAPAMAATESFTAGAYIIDMGQAAQTVANGLKPYGLVYELAVNRGIPVKWAIEPSKARGGSDFIAAGKTYKGSAFIVPATFAADAATAIATWRTTGVIVDGPLAVGFTAPIYDTITSFPRTALDQTNGSIAQNYLNNAGIPAVGSGPYGTYNTYRFATPAQLNDCDDLYVMPHADPTWATHNNLIPFNAGKGYIWAACHAVNVLENIDDPGDADTAPDMNFLSTNGLVPHKSHANAVPPYTYKPIADADPIMQFIGSLDGATDNGSEQVYLPNLTSSWRPTTRIAVIDPDHPQVPPASSVLSPGEAIKVTYGHGFGDINNGMVMYEGGHNHTGSGTLAEQVAAQRAFLNFALLAGIERRLNISSTIPINMVSGTVNNVSTIATGGSGIYTYKWYSSCGGTFANSSAASTTFTAPTTGASCSLRVVVSDSCGRRSINAAPVLFPVVPARIISGTVFEDVNYGGGLGRSQAVASGVGRPNATVELYDSFGSYVRNVIADVNGKYAFTNLPDNSNYQIRVVNSTVTSSRNNAAAGLLPVQTFRTDAGTTTATGTTVSGLFDRVGGEKPSEVDPAANSGLQTLTDLNNLTKQEVQSLTLVKIATTDIGGIDFGYNFDTIVNTSNNDQGSLAQFISNSNALPNSTLDQVANSIFDPPLGREVSIFMISNQSAHPGLRAGLLDQLTNGVAVIAPTTLLPIITDNSTSIDGRTQTANIGDLNVGSAGYVGKVGTGADGVAGTADDLTIAAVTLPEVQITGARLLIYGIGIDAQQTIIQGISLYGFGNDPYKQADIAFVGAQGQNSLITNNIIGSAANGFIDPGAATRGSAGIRSNTANLQNTQVLHNLIGFHSYYGIGVTDTDGAKWDSAVISTNTISNNGLDASATLAQAGIELDTPGYLGFVGSTISQNILDANGNQGIQNNYGKNVTISNNTITNSGRLTNGANSTEGMGILLLGSQSSTVSQNLVYGGNYEGIAISGLANVKITKNSLYNNGTLGIDLIGIPGVSANNGTMNAAIANQDLDYPIITSTNLTSGTLRAKGFVGNLTAGNPIFAGTTLEFFIADNNPANQDGEAILGDGKTVSHGEGRTYLGYCAADAIGQFDCSFPSAGALGLTDAKNITATTTNSNGNTSEFSAVTLTVIVSGNPNVLLVKRITAIDSNTNTSNGQSFSSYYDEASNPYDDNVLDSPAPTPPDTDKWPNISSFLIGVTDGGKIKPKSILDYTIYFLSAGDVPANHVAICDLVPTHQTFKPNGFNNVTHAANGMNGADRGILAQINGETFSYTNLADGDAGRYYPPGEVLPNACKLPSGTIPSNDQGAIVVTLGDIIDPANATATNQSQGFIRFQVQVD
jgi:parallel beta-helix repeat protein